MADADAKDQPSLVERWLREQAQWQRTMLSYLDSMAKDDEFLVHLGNAMRGSLLAGKSYPAPAAPAAATPQTPADDRLDRILFALHELQGRIQDLAMSLEEIRSAQPGARTENSPVTTPKTVRTRRAPARRPSRSRDRKARA